MITSFGGCHCSVQQRKAARSSESLAFRLSEITEEDSCMIFFAGNEFEDSFATLVNGNSSRQETK